MTVNIFCIGDVVGRAGRDVLAEHLPTFIAEHSVEFVVCNAENSAGGSGLTPAIFEEVLGQGVDVVTVGDIFRVKVLQVDAERRRIALSRKQAMS